MYLDPGLGGLLIQLVVAIVAVGGVFAFTLRKKIKALFSGKNKNDIADQSTREITHTEDDAVDMLPDDE